MLWKNCFFYSAVLNVHLWYVTQLFAEDSQIKIRVYCPKNAHYVMGKTKLTTKIKFLSYLNLKKLLLDCEHRERIANSDWSIVEVVFWRFLGEKNIGLTKDKKWRRRTPRHRCPACHVMDPLPSRLLSMPVACKWSCWVDCGPSFLY